MIMTLAQVLKKYDENVALYKRSLEEQVHDGVMTPKTLENYGFQLNLFRKWFVQEHVRDEEVAYPSDRDLLDYRHHIEAEGKSKGSVRTYMIRLVAFSDFCDEIKDKGFVERVVPRAKKGDDVVEIPLTNAQVQALWRNEPVRKRGVRVSFWPRNYALVVTLLATKIRLTELSGIKVKDIDWELDMIHVHGKGLKDRFVELPAIARTAIEIYMQSGLRPEGLSDDDYLFGTCERDYSGRLDGDDTAWRRLSDRSIQYTVEAHVRLVTGVAGVHPHMLRHIGARLDLNNGVQPLVLQRELGHNNYSTTQHYAQILGTRPMRKAAIDTYAERDRQAEVNLKILEEMSLRTG